jgi:hypothetical protein
MSPKARVSKMAASLDAKTWIELIALGSTLLVGGMRLGSAENKIHTLEQRQDPTADIAAMKAQMNDISSDVHDIKKLLSRQLTAQANP